MSEGVEAFEQSHAAKMLRELTKYDDGWDGEFSKAPADEAICEARKFCAMAHDAGMPARQVSALSDGQVVAYWKYGDIMAEAQFDGDGHPIIASAVSRSPARGVNSGSFTPDASGVLLLRDVLDYRDIPE